MPELVHFVKCKMFRYEVNNNLILVVTSYIWNVSGALSKGFLIDFLLLKRLSYQGLDK